jgi:hypothetical protein
LSGLTLLTVNDFAGNVRTRHVNLHRVEETGKFFELTVGAAFA